MSKHMRLLGWKRTRQERLKKKQALSTSFAVL
jgi:hypothetical protein